MNYSCERKRAHLCAPQRVISCAIVGCTKATGYTAAFLQSTDQERQAGVMGRASLPHHSMSERTGNGKPFPSVWTIILLRRMVSSNPRCCACSSGSRILRHVRSVVHLWIGSASPCSVRNYGGTSSASPHCILLDDSRGCRIGLCIMLSAALAKCSASCRERAVQRVTFMRCS